MNSTPKNHDGAVESCTIIQLDQQLAKKCGRNRRVDAKRKFSGPPAPLSYRDMYRGMLKAEREQDEVGWPSPELHHAAVLARCALWTLAHNNPPPPSALAVLAEQMPILDAARDGIGT